MKKIILTMSCLASLASYAGGFRISLQGVKQFAMAHTSAHAEDASAAFYNPAAISFIPARLSVAVGGFGAFSEINYQNLNTLENVKTDNPTGTPIYAALTYKIIDQVSVGFSFTTPFGSTVQYPTDWSGREMVTKMALKSFFYQPMISVKLAPWASVGASYIFATGEVDWDKAITQQSGTLNVLDKKAKGHGMSLGFYFKPDDRWEITTAYRSPVNMKAEHGVATFNLPKSVLANLRVPASGQDAFTATLPLVEEYTLGASVWVTPKWKLAADFNYHGWEKYSKLDLDFANALVGNTDDRTIQSTPKNFHNTKTFRIGTEYRFRPTLAGRLGYYYDESPYKDEWFIAETPSFNTSVVTAGLGFKFGGLGVDVAGGLAFPQARTFTNAYYNFSGQAKAKAYYMGLGLSYNLK